MIHTQTDVLLLPRDELALALTAEVVGRELDWAESYSSALATLDDGLRQHIALVESDDGIFAKVELTRPTVLRQINHLRREHIDLLHEVRELQRLVTTATRAFQPRRVPGPFDLPEAESRACVPDFGALRDRAERLLALLERHEEAEHLIVMESVTTDIGAGD